MVTDRAFYVKLNSKRVNKSSSEVNDRCGKAGCMTITMFSGEGPLKMGQDSSLDPRSLYIGPKKMREARSRALMKEWGW